MAIHRAVATILLLAAITAAVSTAAAKDDQGAGGGRVPPPLPLAAVTVRCTKFHVLKEGETCASVARDFRLTLTQFLVLNKDYNYTCGAAPLPRGRWVCVRGIFIG
jgi:hypothetical protein